MKFVELYQEMIHNTEIIRTLTANISQEEAQTKPTPEAWSILEVICHLYDEEREDFREHLDFILHRQNEEWQTIDPTGWVVSRKYNEQDMGEIWENFLEERNKSLGWLQSISNSNWETAYSSQFGLMKAGDMFASWVAHDNLHIRQLVELRRYRIERMTQPFDIQYAGDW